jgi:predicted  nucleic acid-binding Zn-ribbon protein
VLNETKQHYNIIIMVNLVVRHDSPIHGNSSPMVKSPSAIASRIASANKNAGERVIPSPIRVTRRANSHRPVSPLTASESMFGNTTTPRLDPVPGRAHSSDSTEERQQPSVTSDNSKNSAGELVCDYDQSCTVLYEMLEESKWDEARVRCRTHPREVHTWIVRRDNSQKIRWRLLPLHAAVIFQAPFKVVDDLIKEHPLAAAKRDDQGMLPLHLAFRHKSDEAVIEKLLHQYPSGVIVKDVRNRLPLEHGKEIQYSSNLMNLYAETYAKSQHHVDLNQATTVEGADMKLKSSYESKVAALKDAYEARIDSLIKEHETMVQDLRLKAQKDAQAAQSIHIQEMDELRDLLSREVTSGQKTSQLEAEIRELTDSLAEANQESKVLRRVVHDQKSQQDALVERMHQILKEQKTLHEICVQQQEQLDQAHQLREQLLRTLLQKDDGKAVRVSSEVCQMSKSIIARTEQALQDASLGHSGAEGLVTDTTSKDRGVTVSADAARIGTAERGASDWGAIDDHGDDISAITDNSNF